MLKQIIRTAGMLLIIDAVVFAAMIALAMTDETPPAFGSKLYWVLKYILGFPGVLINKNFPFFLDSRPFPLIGILVIILNNLALALMILGMKKSLINVFATVPSN